MMLGKGFFRIDRRTWAKVCELGMNPAVAYLVLACGTGKDHRGTSWSVQAVQKYTGVAWIHGRPAVNELCDQGFIKLVKSGTRPRYELLEWEEIEAARRARAPQMDAYASTVHDKIARGCQPRSKTEKVTAEQLVQAGRLWVCEGKYVVEPPADDTPLWEHYIWLPQTLVTGTSAGEVSPLERVRRGRDVLTLRLLVDLYHAHQLVGEGGVLRSVVYQKFERSRVGEQGRYVVWSFSLIHTQVRRHPITESHWREQDGRLVFWRRLQQLQDQGLIDFIPHLFEGDSPTDALIHPYGIDWGEEGLQDPENAIGRAAHKAGEAMKKPEDITELTSRRAGFAARPWTRGYLAPVARDYPDVQMIGIARLRYRPHTGRTGEWRALLYERLPTFIAKYRELAGQEDSTNLVNVDFANSLVCNKPI